ncbi:MAG: hypothetical protein ACPGUY_06410 [Akkermansiaceae bacterium]
MSECFKSGVVHLLAEDMWSARELLQDLFPEAVPVRSGGFEVRPGLLVKPVSARGVPNWLRVTVRPQVVYSEGVSKDFLVGPYLSPRSPVLKPLGEWLEELGVSDEQQKCPRSGEGLQALVVNGQLTISVGVGVLAKMVEYGVSENHLQVDEALKVTDPVAVAQLLARELTADVWGSCANQFFALLDDRVNQMLEDGERGVEVVGNEA